MLPMDAMAACWLSAGPDRKDFLLVASQAGSEAAGMVLVATTERKHRESKREQGGIHYGYCTRTR